VLRRADRDLRGVWTINGDGALLRLDPTTAKVVATTPLGRDPFPFAIAAIHDSVWVTKGNDQTVLRLQPQS